MVERLLYKCEATVPPMKKNGRKERRGKREKGDKRKKRNKI
jgi:hypothetical protein